MSERFAPTIAVDDVALLTCGKCGFNRMCVSLASTTKVKELYDAPLYCLALCLRCLGVLSRRITAARPVAAEEEPGDDILEEDDERD